MDLPLCAKGCGFYGSASNKNLCSKCYNDYLKENIIRSQDIETKNMMKNKLLVLETLNSHKPSCAIESFIRDIRDAIDNASNTIIIEESKKNVKKRCKSCNKKVGLIGFKCCCGELFCGKHRYPEEHACEVNHKEIGRKILIRENPKCISDKLETRL